MVKNREGQDLRGELDKPPGDSDTNVHFNRYLDWENLKPAERLSKIETIQKRARWDDEWLEYHYKKHGPDLGLKSDAEYVALSKKVLREFDRLFLYQMDDASTEPRRFGFFNDAEGIFVGVDDDNSIRTMFPIQRNDRQDYFGKMVRMR